MHRQHQCGRCIGFSENIDNADRVARPGAEATQSRRHGERQQASVGQPIEVLERKARVTIMPGRAGGKPGGKQMGRSKMVTHPSKALRVTNRLSHFHQVASSPSNPRSAAQLHQFGVAAVPRIGPIDRDIGLDPRRPLAQHDDAFARNNASSGRGSPAAREAGALPERDQLRLHGDAGQRVQLAERLVEHQQRGSLTRARARAARCAMPPESWCGRALAKPARPTSRAPRRRAPLARRSPRLPGRGDVLPHGAPGIQGRILEHHQPRGIGPVDRRSRPRMMLPARAVEPGNQPQQRRLAATARARAGRRTRQVRRGS